eukprot:TRINITY_DN18305_c0_g1_i1.p1 TRINITY_DN18305_c0_g1~~TRINITY_DN18305_c0_g1_i1.p1  ORF type:complete len:1661 (-),score=461.62 TRINITY_DN18305_c0_g1_i1:25-4656(-)
MWDWVDSKEWSFTWMSLFSRLAEDFTGKEELTWDEPLFFSHIVRHTGLAVGGSSLVKLKSEPYPSKMKIFLPHSGMQQFKAAARWIVFALSPSNTVLSNLGKFLEQIISYFHPSNDGNWAMTLASFIENLTYLYLTRMKLENTKKIPAVLNEDTHKQFASILLPAAQGLLYSKKFHISKIGALSLGKLSRVHAESIYPSSISRILYLLSSPTSARLTAPACDASSSMVPSVINFKEFSMQLPNLLSLNLLTLDPNDPLKSFGGCKFFYGLFSFVPLFQKFVDSKSMMDEEMVASRKMVVEGWGEFTVCFMDKMIEYLYHKEEESNTNNPLEQTFQLLFKRMIISFFMQLSPELHKVAVEKLAKYVQQNVVINAKYSFAQLCKAATRAQPEASLKIFFDYLLDGIINTKTNKLKNSENKIIWSMLIISRVVRYGGSHILKYRDNLISLIRATHQDFTKKKILVQSNKLLRNTLKALTQVYPLDLRCLPANIWNSEEYKRDHWKRWGEVTEVNPEWHIPSNAEINFAKELIQLFGGEALDCLEGFTLKTPEKQLSDKQVAVYLSRVRTVLNGSGAVLEEKKENVVTKSGVELKQLGFTPLIPLELREKEFRSRASRVCHAVAVHYLDPNAHYIPTMNNLAKVIEVLLSVRATKPSKLGELKSSGKLFERFFYNPLSKFKYPRSISIEKQFRQYIAVLNDELYCIPFNEDTLNLFNDLISLYMRHFEPFKGKHVSIVGRLKQIPAAVNHFLPKLITRLSIAESTESEINAVISILSDPFVMRKILQNWTFLDIFIRNLLLAYVHENPTTQSKLYNLFSVFITQYYTEPVHYSLPQEASLSKIVEENNSVANLKYSQLIQFLVQNIDSTNPVHWKYEIMALGALMAILRSRDIEKYALEILKSAFMVLDNADLPLARKLSIEIISAVLAKISYKKTERSVVAPPSLGQFWEELPNESNWDNFNYLDKVYLGWNSKFSTFKDVDVKFSKTENITKFLDSKLSDVSFITKLLKKIEQDHNFSNEEDNSSQNKQQNMFSFFMQLKQPDSTKKDTIFKLIGSNHSPTWTRIDTDMSSGFSLSYSLFWQYFVGSSSIGSLQNVIPLLLNYMVDQERGQHCTVVEFFAGLLRQTRFMTKQEYDIAVAHLSKLLINARDHFLSKEVTNDWAFALRWGIYGQDPRRFNWMTSILYSDPLNPGKSTQLQTQQVSLLANYLREMSWRGIPLSEQILQYLSAHMDNPNKQVREAISHLLFIIFSIHLLPDGDLKLFSSEKLLEFSGQLVNRLEKTISQNDDSSERFRETVLQWLCYTMDHPAAIIQYVPPFLPLVFQLQTECAENTRNLAKIVIALASQLQFKKNQLTSFVDSTLRSISKTKNWRDRSPLCPTIQIFVFNHSFLLGEENLSNVFEIVLYLLGDAQIEVAESSKRALSSVIRTTGTKTIHQLITQFKSSLSTSSKSKTKSKDLTSTQKGLLGLSALVESQPYGIPSWLPEAVVLVSDHVQDPHPLKKIASECLKEFWRTHQDEWIFEQNKFTPEQIEAISQTTAPSYFA